MSLITLHSVFFSIVFKSFKCIVFFVKIKPLGKENRWPDIWETLLILSSRQVLQTRDVWSVMEQLKTEKING